LFNATDLETVQEENCTSDHEDASEPIDSFETFPNWCLGAVDFQLGEYNEEA
jgi:hypothetical protein